MRDFAGWFLQGGWYDWWWCEHGWQQASINTAVLGRRERCSQKQLIDSRSERRSTRTDAKAAKLWRWLTSNHYSKKETRASNLRAKCWFFARVVAQARSRDWKVNLGQEWQWTRFESGAAEGMGAQIGTQWADQSTQQQVHQRSVDPYEE